MAYVGNQPARGQWRKLTDISASFNGVLTTFTTSVPPGTSEYYVTAGSASQLIVSLGGVIQQPDTDYTVTTNSITFTTAPTAGLSFFGVLCGDALNTSALSDGTVTSSKLASDLNVGLAAGSAAAPSLFFTGDSNTGVYSPGADQIAIATGGTGRLSVDASGNVTVNAQGDVRFGDSDSSNYVGFQAPAVVAADLTWTLPAADGTNGQVLGTNGTGTLAWVAAGGSYTYTQTAISKTLSNNERCTVTSAFLTLNLPTPPSAGNEVSVIVGSGSSGTIIAGVGYPIMGLLQDLTLDSVDKTVTLVYIDSVFGWRIF